ncbi:MAG: hypothetical protein ACT4OP_03545 [Actinomycetota bacterium]
MTWRPEVDVLEKRRLPALQLGGAERVDRHRASRSHPGEYRP